MHAPALLIQAIVIAVCIFVGLGLIKWGMDLLKEQFGGKQAKQRDENVANQRLASGKKMYGSINSAPTGSDLTSDKNIEKLIRDGNLEEAFREARYGFFEELMKIPDNDICIHLIDSALRLALP